MAASTSLVATATGGVPRPVDPTRGAGTWAAATNENVYRNGDGICDDVDTCVGDLDECGVCNGPGPTEVVIEDITILYDSVSEGK